MINPKNLPEPENWQPIKHALLSVSDKTGLVPFATKLHEMGVSLISTGGTARTLKEAGLPVKEVNEITNFPEIMDGRVKTLHPVVHGGLLARRNDPEDIAQLEAINAKPIDLVVVNLYPFTKATAQPGISDALAIENIDIGGPTMIRAAAKNFFFVGVITSPNDYDELAETLLQNDGKLDLATRRKLAHKAFAHTAQYDSAIDAYFQRTAPDTDFPDTLTLTIPSAQSLRYGENPHQKAHLYGYPEQFFTTLHGKQLSFNNLLDVSAACFLIDEFMGANPTCAIFKHTNPCGVGTANNLVEAYRKAFATDRQSPFGGIVVVNCPLDLETAQAIDEIFTEIIIAPEYEAGVLDFLMQKKNRRLIQMNLPARADQAPDIRSVLGGILVQERDAVLATIETNSETYKIVTNRAPTEAEMHDLDFAWRVAKHVKSNAIVYAKNGATLGIGAGQMSRIDASEIAVQKGNKSELDFTNCVIASDAFFPFADGLLEAAKAGAIAVIQPGGSIRDEEVIEAANEHDIAMVFTGKRHFRH